MVVPNVDLGVVAQGQQTKKSPRLRNVPLVRHQKHSQKKDTCADLTAARILLFPKTTLGAAL